MADMRNNASGRRRTAIACRRCNAKKVRCNAQKGRACSNCTSKGVECVPIDSQRGKYERRRNNDYVYDQRSRLAEASTAPRFDTFAETDQRQDGNLGISPNNIHDAQTPSRQDSSAMLYAQVAERGIDQVQHPITQSTTTYFLGEAFSLTYVINDVLVPFLRGATPMNQRRLHYPIPKASRANPYLEQKTLLKNRGLYHALPRIHTAKLLSFYFKWFHPAYPIVDQVHFTHQVEADEASLLILNAVLMIAVTICPENDLLAAGLPERYTAREIFYRQAKLLYDEDADIEMMNVVVATFLLSFWWGGPDESKDTWHWLGISLSQAQSLGMHRSTLKSGMEHETRRKWRRIWWSIRIREALVSGSIGRPQRFTERDCDVELLEPEDIPGDDVQRQYICQMARLGQILTNVITARYAGDQSSRFKDRFALEDALMAFQRTIPSILQYHICEPRSEQRLWAAMLRMAFNHTTILLCRPSRSVPGDDQVRTWGNRALAFRAANDVSRIMEDLLMDSMGQLCQIHTIPALHNALAMHLLTICTSNSMERELAENHVRVCMLGLEKLQQSWPVVGWVLLMFKTFIHKLQEKYRENQHTITRVWPVSQPTSELRSTSDAARFDAGFALQSSDNPTLQSSSAQRSYAEGYSSTIGGGVDVSQATSGLNGNTEEISFNDWPFIQSLFDIDPHQSNPSDPDGFFELLNIPALGNNG